MEEERKKEEKKNSKKARDNLSMKGNNAKVRNV